MVCTSEYVKLRILALFRLNFKVCQVVRELSREGIKITRKTVGKFFKKFRDEDFALCDLPRCGRPKSLQQRHLDFIDTKMEENNIVAMMDSLDVMERDIRRSLRN